jgi:hypothetical protein
MERQVPGSFGSQPFLCDFLCQAKARLGIGKHTPCFRVTLADYPVHHTSVLPGSPVFWIDTECQLGIQPTQLGLF